MQFWWSFHGKVERKRGGKEQRKEDERMKRKARGGRKEERKIRRERKGRQNIFQGICLVSSNAYFY